jgi:hypothetical protein
MKEISTHVKWRAVSLSCVASKLLAESEQGGNKGNEMSMLLPCHGKSGTSCQEGGNSSLNINLHEKLALLLAGLRSLEISNWHFPTQGRLQRKQVTRDDGSWRMLHLSCQSPIN